MSVYTWAEKFCPVNPRSAGRKQSTALNSSVLQLEGMLKKNLAEHQCRPLKVLGCLTIQDRHGNILPRWYADFPLCIWAWNEMRKERTGKRKKRTGDMCSFCPVWKARGGNSCYTPIQGESCDPWHEYHTKFDARPMLVWFRRAEKSALPRK